MEMLIDNTINSGDDDHGNNDENGDDDKHKDQIIQ